MQNSIVGDLNMSFKNIQLVLFQNKSLKLFQIKLSKPIIKAFEFNASRTNLDMFQLLRHNFIENWLDLES